MLAAVVLTVFVVRWWNRPPALEFDNLKYIQLLTTAVSARDEEWLDGVTRAIELRHQSGQMSDEEREALHGVIAQAESGEWERADRECYELAVAQLSRRRSPPDEAGHAHVH